MSLNRSKAYKITVTTAFVELLYTNGFTKRLNPCRLDTIGSHNQFFYMRWDNAVYRFDCTSGLIFDNGLGAGTYYHPIDIVKDFIWPDCAGEGGGPGGNVTEYTQNFLNALSVTVTHNLNDQYPDITVVDGNDNSIGYEVEFTDANTLELSFNQPVSGTITCRAVS